MSWIFPWGTNYYGLLFNGTNTNPSVKAAIRDDVAVTLSFNAPSNAIFNLLEANNKYYGTFDGQLIISNKIVPDNFPLRYYNTINSTNYFVISEMSVSNYLEQIALTNQCHSEMQSLTNFLLTVNQIATNTFSPSALASLYWSIKDDRAVTLDGDLNGDVASCLNRIENMTHENYFFLSILDVTNEELFGKTWLTVGLRIRQKSNPSQIIGDRPVVYRNGQWRFIPGYETP